jgi:hypothetical protein
MKCDRSAKRDRFIFQILRDQDELVLALQAAGMPKEEASKAAYQELTQRKKSQA